MPTTRASIHQAWQRDLVRQLRRQGVDVPAGGGLHLAVLVEPYLSMILDGRKRIESRFAHTRKPPFLCAAAGDLVALKRSSGPVMGVAAISKVSFHELTPRTLLMLRLRHARAIGDESDTFWAARQHMRFASLFHLARVRAVVPFPLAKTDRRGWVVIEGAAQGFRM